MTLLKFELKQHRISLAVWTLSIASMVVICLMIFPDMKQEAAEITAAFASMGSFTSAFGMDSLNLGELMGFYGLEIGNILGIGGAFFAAYIGITALAGEEAYHTAEFLLTHPAGRTRIVSEKLLRVISEIVILNLIVLLSALGTLYLIGEKPDMEQLFLLHTAYLLMQVETAAICFAFSAFLRRNGTGIALGLATVFYFLNIIANITDSAEWLKYLTPFGYAEASDIIEKTALSLPMVALGAGVTVCAVGIAFFVYRKKDIH